MGGNVYNVWADGVCRARWVDYFTAVVEADVWLAADCDDVVIELSQEDCDGA